MRSKNNEEAVSPVIGVILMVAITVILAAVIAAFVFGMTPPPKAPQASLRLELNSTTPTNIDVRHQGGDQINWNTTTVVATGGIAASPTGNLTAGNVYKTIATGTAGTEVRVTIIDKTSQQLILDARIMP